MTIHVCLQIKYLFVYLVNYVSLLQVINWLHCERIVSGKN